MQTQLSMFEGVAEALPPQFIFQEKNSESGIDLTWEGNGRWQAERSEQTGAERCSAGNVPKQEARWLDKWM